MEQTKKQGMKWFFFLIYFLIWVKIIGLTVSGISQLVYVYNGVFILLPEKLYTNYPILQNADILAGGVNLLFALLFFIARFRLAKFKKGAPTFYIKLIYTLLFLNVPFSLFLNILDYFVVEAAANTTSIGLFLFSEIVSAILTLALNLLIYKLEKIYFRKREHLFVN